MRLTAFVGAVIACGTLSAHPEIEEQIARINTEMQAQPNDARLYIRRGELHRLHQDWSAAFADFDQADKIDPDITDTQYCRGRAQLESGKATEALDSLKAYLVRVPNSAEGYAQYARALLALGKLDEAIVAYDKSLANRLSPRPEDYLEYAEALAKSGTSDASKQAVEVLRNGIEKLGSIASLETAALDIEIKLKQNDDALTRLDRLIAAANRPEAWLERRGDLLTSLTRTADARESYDRALKAIESLPPARRGDKSTRERAARLAATLGRSQSAVRSEDTITTR